MNLRVIGLLTCFLCCSPLNASAATITTNGAGEVTGISALSVGGDFYNLSFVGFGESYGTVFGGSLDVNSEEEASDIVAAAVIVLNDSSVLNTSIAGNPVTSISEDTNLLLPFALDSGKVRLFELDWAEPLRWRPQPVGPFPVNPTDFLPDTAWIRVSPVPLPAAAWLFGSALFGLVAVKRKKA